MAYPLFITLLFLFFPFLALPFTVHGLFTSKKYAGWFGLLLAATIGLVVYGIVPNFEMDLYRYYEHLDELNMYSFGNAITTIWEGNDPLTYTFMYLVSYTFSNNLIPFIVALIDYSILFYIALDYRKTVMQRYDWRTSVVLLFILTTFIIFNNLTGIRFGLSLSIFTLALYLDVIKGKKISWVLYALTPLIHSSAVLLLLLRIGTWIFRKRPILLYAIAAITGSATSFLLIFSERLAQLPFLAHVGDRANDYLIAGIPSGFVYPFNIFSCVLMLVIIFLMRNKNETSSVITRLNIASIIIAFANFSQFVIASRFTTMSKFIFILVLLQIMHNLYNKEGKIQITTRHVIAFCALFIIMAGNLAYQFIAFENVDFIWSFPDVILQGFPQVVGNS